MNPEKDLVEGRLQGKFPPVGMSMPKGKKKPKAKRKKPDEDGY